MPNVVTSSSALVYFEESVQNLFPVCESRRARRHTFESLEGEITEIVEEVPCLNRTLAERQ